MDFVVAQKGGVFYTIENRDSNKGDFNKRLKFIFSGSINNKEEFTKRFKLSNCYMNTMKLGVTYSEEIQKQLTIVKII
jgi:hypothetical protein